MSGTCCGILETILQNDISPMGMLCAAGVLSGLFRSLGKAGSMLGFLSGAVSLGILYLPQGIDGRLGEFFLAAAVFLLTPRGLCGQIELRKEPVSTFSFYFPGREQAAAGRVKTVSESMDRLARTFSGQDGDQEDECVVEEGIPTVDRWEQEEEPGSLVWRERYEECREAVAGGFREMERIPLAHLGGDRGHKGCVGAVPGAVETGASRPQDRHGEPDGSGAGAAADGDLSEGPCKGKPVHDGAGAFGDGEPDRGGKIPSRP